MNGRRELHLHQLRDQGADHGGNLIDVNGLQLGKRPRFRACLEDHCAIYRHSCRDTVASGSGWSEPPKRSSQQRHGGHRQAAGEQAGTSVQRATGLPKTPLRGLSSIALMDTCAGASASWSFPARVLNAFQLLQCSIAIALPPVAAAAGEAAARLAAGGFLVMAFLTDTFFLAGILFFGGMAVQCGSGAGLPRRLGRWLQDWPCHASESLSHAGTAGCHCMLQLQLLAPARGRVE